MTGKFNGSIIAPSFISFWHARAPFPLNNIPQDPHCPALHELLKLMSASYLSLIA